VVKDWVMVAVYTFFSLDDLAFAQEEVLLAAIKVNGIYPSVKTVLSTYKLSWRHEGVSTTGRLAR
jgi:hypothetical protein